MLSKTDDVESVTSSVCGGDLNNGESPLVKPKEAESIEEMGQLSIALSDNCSRVIAKRRVVDNQETEDSI